MIRYDNHTYSEDKSMAILLATYNGERFLLEQLQSLADQSEQGFICFIHDDCSADATAELVEGFCAEHPEHFVYVGSDKCGCAMYNFLHMLRRVEADYLMFCDQDDVWLPEKVQVTLQQLKELESTHGKDKPLLVYGDLRVVDASLQPLRERMWGAEAAENSLRDLFMYNRVTGCTVMLNACLRQLMLSPVDFDHIVMHDWWAAMIADALGAVAYMPEPLILYRQHEGNVCGATNLIEEDSLRKKLKDVSTSKAYYFLTYENLALAQRHAKELAKVVPIGSKHGAMIHGLARLDELPTLRRFLFCSRYRLIRKLTFLGFFRWWTL